MSDVIGDIRRQLDKSWDSARVDNLHAAFTRLYGDKLLAIAEAADRYCDSLGSGNDEHDEQEMQDYNEMVDALKALEEA